jgi:hypothetical protein
VNIVEGLIKNNGLSSHMSILAKKLASGMSHE